MTHNNIEDFHTAGEWQSLIADVNMENESSDNLSSELHTAFDRTGVDSRFANFINKQAGAWGERSFDNDAVHDVLDKYRPDDQGDQGFDQPVPREVVSQMIEELDPKDEQTYLGTIVFLCSHGSKQFIPLPAINTAKNIAERLLDDQGYLARWREPEQRKKELQSELALLKGGSPTVTATAFPKKGSKEFSELRGAIVALKSKKASAAWGMSERDALTVLAQYGYEWDNKQGRPIKIAYGEEYGIRWQEFDKNNRVVTKEKFFPSSELREGFAHKLEEKDNFKEFVSSHDSSSDKKADAPAASKKVHQFQHDAEIVVSEVLNGGFEQLWNNNRGYGVRLMLQRTAQFFQDAGRSDLAAIFTQAAKINAPSRTTWDLLETQFYNMWESNYDKDPAKERDWEKFFGKESSVTETKKFSALKKAAWLGFKPEYPVQVVGVQGGEITPSGRGYQEFPNFEAAKAVFPELDPNVSGKNFTWAMRGQINDQIATRFETWPANDMYSR